MLATKEVELARSEPFRRPGLHLFISPHVSPSLGVNDPAYCEDKGTGCVQRKLNQVPLHSHVIEHVLGTVQSDAMQQGNEG